MSASYHINKAIIEIVQSDITDQQVDAVVNAANNHLWMGGGVAGAIKRKGGVTIEQEAMKLGPAEVGTAVLTSGGNLKAKHVIHAVVMGQDLHTDEIKIRNSTKSALQLAEQKKISSVSFPALGTGVGGFSIFHCAKIMITEAIEFLIKAENVKLIRFVLYDDETFHAFEEELKIQFTTKRHPG
ncbi:MAG: macro domain-containing protein [Ignavibacteriales bacterium]|nr:macro domain-containing protein [Ignavibacteriales bacterium]